MASNLPNIGRPATTSAGTKRGLTIQMPTTPATAVEDVEALGSTAHGASAPSGATLKKQYTIGVSALKKQKAAKAAQRTALKREGILDTLVGRDEVLANLHLLLARAEVAAPSPTPAAAEDALESSYASETDFASATPPPHPPQAPRPPLTPRGGATANGRSHASTPRGPGGSGGFGATQTLNGKPSRAGSAASSATGGGAAARTRPNNPSRAFLLNVLAPNRTADNGGDALLPETVPTWKEELVERVRRRTAAKRGSSRGGSASGAASRAPLHIRQPRRRRLAARRVGARQLARRRRRRRRRR